MTTHEVLIQARELIADEHRHTTGVFQSGDAHCASGALMASGARAGIMLDPAYHALQRAMYGPRVEVGEFGPSVCAWNDHHTHPEVVAAFDRAIAATAPTPDMSWLTAPAEDVRLGEEARA